MELTERIQTKSGQKWVAGKADLFIGSMETVVIQDAMAVRAIPDSMYQIVKNHEGGTFEVKDKQGQVVTQVKVPVGTTKGYRRHGQARLSGSRRGDAGIAVHHFYLRPFAALY